MCGLGNLLVHSFGRVVDLCDTAVIRIQTLEIFSYKITLLFWPQLIAMACLYLGGKLEDTPKSAKDVIATCCSRRFDPGSSAGPRIYDAVGIQKGFVGCAVCMHRLCVCVCLVHGGKWHETTLAMHVHSVAPLLIR